MNTNRRINISTVLEDDATILRAEVLDSDGQIHGVNGRLSHIQLHQLELSGRYIAGSFLVDMGRKLMEDAPEHEQASEAFGEDSENTGDAGDGS